MPRLYTILHDRIARYPSLMNGAKRWRGPLACLVVLIAMLAFRLELYGDPRLAIGTSDTASYIQSSRAPLLSWKSFAGRRLFTTNLLYKIVSDNSDCGKIIGSTPASGEELHREVLPCYGTIALLQAIISVAGWLLLALVIARHLKTWLAGMLAVVTIVLFPLAPQIMGWDNVLGSEALTVSLLVLSFAVLIEIVMLLADPKASANRSRKIIIVLWLVIFLLWVFVRDANLYALVITLLLMIPLFLLKSLEERKTWIALAVLLVAVLVLGVISSRQSPRWPPSLEHSLETYVLPYPSRVQFLARNFGMPSPESAEFKTWFDAKAPTAFMVFVVSHPGFISTAIADNRLIFTILYVEPYYPITDIRGAAGLMNAAALLHSDSGVFYLIDTILLISFLAAAVAKKDSLTAAWAWLFSWLYFTCAITLFVSFFGDTNGIMRHVFPSLEFFRLLMWLGLLVQADFFIWRPPVGSSVLSSTQDFDPTMA